MTNIATIGHNNVTTFGITYLYRLAASGSGAAKTLAYSFTQAVTHVGAIFSYSGVGSVSTATTSTGQSASPSIGPASFSSNSLVLGVIGVGTGANASAITATSGGINRVTTNGASNWCALAVTESTTSPATFGTTQSASMGWSAISLVLSPPDGPATNQFFQMF
jgi:hypothetical protein